MSERKASLIMFGGVLPSINHFIYCVMEAKQTINELKVKIKPFEELITILNARIKEIQKRLDSDVIVDMRWQCEIQDDKNEILIHKAEILGIEKEVKRWKRSIAILESNKY